MANRVLKATDLTIDGNLVVTGTTASVESTNSTLKKITKHCPPDHSSCIYQPVSWFSHQSQKSKLESTVNTLTIL